MPIAPFAGHPLGRIDAASVRTVGTGVGRLALVAGGAADRAEVDEALEVVLAGEVSVSFGRRWRRPVTTEGSTGSRVAPRLL